MKQIPSNLIPVNSLTLPKQILVRDNLNIEKFFFNTEEFGQFSDSVPERGLKEYIQISDIPV